MSEEAVLPCNYHYFVCYRQECDNRYVYHFVCSHHYTTMVHCVGVSIGGVIIAVILVVVIVLILLLCCKHLKKHDIEGQPSTTVRTQHMIIIIMTHAVHISLFIAGQLC